MSTTVADDSSRLARTDDGQIPDWVYRRFETQDRDSSEFVHDVVAGVRNRIGHQVREFQISVLRDGLVLRGVVKSYYSKQLAQEVATKISGLSILANDIEVQCVDLPRDQ